VNICVSGLVDKGYIVVVVVVCCAPGSVELNPGFGSVWGSLAIETQQQYTGGVDCLHGVMGTAPIGVVLGCRQFPGTGHIGFTQPAGEGQAEAMAGLHSLHIGTAAQGGTVGGAQAAATPLATRTTLTVAPIGRGTTAFPRSLKPFALATLRSAEALGLLFGTGLPLARGRSRYNQVDGHGRQCIGPSKVDRFLPWHGHCF